VYPYNSKPMTEIRNASPIISRDIGGSTIKLEIPFDSKYKYQASVHRLQDKIIVVCKGAPDRVIDMCSTINENGSPKSVDDSVKKQVMEANENFASNGRRVLAFS